MSSTPGNALKWQGNGRRPTRPTLEARRSGAPINGGNAARPARPAHVESLEPRLVMAAGPGIGVNLDRIADYYPAWTFKDAFRNARNWSTSGYNTATGVEDNVAGRTAELDAKGYPVALGSWTNAAGQKVDQWLTSYVIDDTYPAGEYRAEWSGDATVDFRFAGVIERGTEADGTHFARLQFSPSTNISVQLKIKAMNPADPIRNVHVWMPDYNGEKFWQEPAWTPGSTTTSPFHPLFLERLQPFGTLRSMEWFETNGSTHTTWDNRKTVDEANQSLGSGRGVAYEYFAELANELDKDVWVNVPYMADANYVSRMATFFRDKLEPGRKVYLEWSNEVWNAAGAFKTYPWVTAQINGNEGQRWPFVASKVKQTFDLWGAAFAQTGQAARLTRVVGGFTANTAATGAILSSLVSQGGDFDAIAGTGYIDLSQSQRSGFNASTTALDVINGLRDNMGATVQGFKNIKGFVDQYEATLGHDLKFVAYEGGQHADARGDANLSYLQALYDAQYNPAMYQVYDDALRQFYEQGGDLFMQYTYLSPLGTYGSWGALQTQTQSLATAPKYRALVDAAAGETWAPEYSIQTFNAAADEQGQKPATFTVIRTGDKSLAQAVTFTVTGVNGSDFTAPAAVNFAAGQASATLGITPVDDAIAEDQEAFAVTLTAATGYRVDDRKGSASGSIADNDGFTLSDFPIANASFESGSLAGWTLAPTTPADQPGGNATAARAAPVANAPAAAHAGSYFAWGTPASGLRADSAALAGVAQRFDVTDQAATIDAGGARLLFAGYGTGEGPGKDYAYLEVYYFDAAGNRIATAAPVVSNSATTPAAWTKMSINTTPPAGTRAIELRAMTRRGPSGSYTDAGFDDLSAKLYALAPTANVAATDPNAAEAGPKSATFTITRDATRLDVPLTVAYAMGGTASADDYQPLSGSVTIPAGATSATVTLTPIDDAAVERAETVELTLVGRAEYLVGSAPTAAATIADNDVPTVSIAAPEFAASEDGRQVALFNVTRDTDVLDAPLTVNYAIGGDAINGSDYAALSGSVTIPAGQRSAAVTVTPVDDRLSERTESVTLTLTGNAAYVVHPQFFAATATILDDDLPTVTIEATDAAGSEAGNDGIAFRIARQGDVLDTALTVYLAVDPSSTATPGVDFTAPPASVTIPAGQRSIGFALAVLNDAAPEPLEAAVLSVTPGAAYTVGSPAAAVATIADDDGMAPSVAGISVNGVAGGGQRSKVSSVVITFSTDVTANAAAFELVQRNAAGGAGKVFAVTLAPVDGKSYTLSIDAATQGVVAGSLPDGVYDLHVRAGGVRDAFAGTAMTSDASFAFHRLFTDVDGDGDVDAADLFQLRRAVNKTSADAAYRWYLDYDASGVIDAADLFQVRSRARVEFKGYGG